MAKARRSLTPEDRLSLVKESNVWVIWKPAGSTIYHQLCYLDGKGSSRKRVLKA